MNQAVLFLIGVFASSILVQPPFTRQYHIYVDADPNCKYTQLYNSPLLHPMNYCNSMFNPETETIVSFQLTCNATNNGVIAEYWTSHTSITTATTTTTTAIDDGTDNNNAIDIDNSDCNGAPVSWLDITPDMYAFDCSSPQCTGTGNESERENGIANAGIIRLKQFAPLNGGCSNDSSVTPYLIDTILVNECALFLNETSTAIMTCNGNMNKHIRTTDKNQASVSSSPSSSLSSLTLMSFWNDFNCDGCVYDSITEYNGCNFNRTYLQILNCTQTNRIRKNEYQNQAPFGTDIHSAETKTHRHRKCVESDASSLSNKLNSDSDLFVQQQSHIPTNSLREILAKDCLYFKQLFSEN